MACKKHGYTNNVFCPACDLEEIEEHKLRKTVETSQMFLSRAAMDALQQAASDIVCHANRKEIRAILDRCTVVEPTAASAEAQEDFKGWYCANCECGVDGRNVTFSEQHDACGRYIANDRPPKALPSTPALREVTEITEAVAAMAEAHECLVLATTDPANDRMRGIGKRLREKAEALESFRARLSTAQGMPGWKLVPTTATPDMVGAGSKAARHSDIDGYRLLAIYRAMIAAATEAP